MRHNMLVLVGVLAAACGGAYTEFHPASVQAPPDAFAKASRVLIDHGESIETKDEAAGILVTKWNEEEFMGGQKRFRWKVTLTNGTLTVSSQCQGKVNDPAPGQRDNWDDCGDRQPSERTDKAKALADEIAK